MGGAFKGGNSGLPSNYGGPPSGSPSSPYPSSNGSRTYSSDKPQAGLGANIAGGLNLGFTDALPEISGQLADLPDFDGLSGAKRETAVRDYLGGHFDPFGELVSQATNHRGYGYDPARQQAQLDSMRPVFIDKMTKGALSELDKRKINPPPPPPDEGNSPTGSKYNPYSNPWEQYYLGGGGGDGAGAP